MIHTEESPLIYDLLIIGGGINGAGIACDAAGCGLKTALLESTDFASGTSSRSSKLIHGGLRYLEYYDFRLVRESLAERELLMKKARHIAWPLRFVMPVVPNTRPAWMVRTGLFLYDHLATRVSLPGTETVRLSKKQDRMGFAEKYDKAFIYSDCWVDDARLVIANLQGAEAAGAALLPRHRFEDAQRRNGYWSVDARKSDTDEIVTLKTRVIVNAAGPWAVPLAKQTSGVTTDFSAKLVRGSHIIVPKLYDGPNATMLQLGDDRIVVTMPYETDYTLIGTTDHEHLDDPRNVAIIPEERDYLIQAVNQFFERKISAKDVVWTYAGVRPLFDEGTSRDNNPTTITRDYSFKIDQGDDGKGAVFLTVLGGKLTTYRKLAAHALKELSPFLSADISLGSTDHTILPGGDIPASGSISYAKTLEKNYLWLSHSHALRLARTYGSLAPVMLADAKSTADMGILFGDDLYAREVDYLISNEWAASTESILWRRTKCGLRFSEQEVAKLMRYVDAHHLINQNQEAQHYVSCR